MLRFDTTEQKEQKTLAAALHSPTARESVPQTENTAETAPARVTPDIHIGRVLRVGLAVVSPVVLVLHVFGLLFASAGASALLTLALLLMGATALPPLRQMRLRDAFRDDEYAFSPFVRELLQLAYNLLMAVGLFAETLHEHGRITGGAWIMAGIFFPMVLACGVKAYGLRPRKVPNR